MPLPHRAVLTPEVSGTLSLEDASPQEIPIKVCLATGDTCCIGAEAHGLVAAAGDFTIALTTELRRFMNAMAHKKFHWCLAIHKEGEWHTAGPYFQYTLVDTGPAFPIRLDCRYGDDGLAWRELPRHIESEDGWGLPETFSCKGHAVGQPCVADLCGFDDVRGVWGKPQPSNFQ